MILFASTGSWGEVSPLVSLAKRFKGKAACGPEWISLVSQYAPAVPIGVDFKHDFSINDFASKLNQRKLFFDLWRASDGCSAIVSSFFLWSAQIVAELRSIPCYMTTTSPLYFMENDYVPRRTFAIKSSSTKTKLVDHELQVRKASTEWAENVPGLPQKIYEELAQISPSYFGAEEKRQLQELCRSLQAKGEIDPAALQMWISRSANASPELRRAIDCDLDVQIMPFGTSQNRIANYLGCEANRIFLERLSKELCEIRHEVGLPERNPLIPSNLIGLFPELLGGPVESIGYPSLPALGNETIEGDYCLVSSGSINPNWKEEAQAACDEMGLRCEYLTGINLNLDHRKLMQNAKAAIVHCGIGTLVDAVAAQVPMICRPYAFDQFYNAEKLISLGATAWPDLQPGIVRADITPLDVVYERFHAITAREH